jgi:hypothetical protein
MHSAVPYTFGGNLDPDAIMRKYAITAGANNFRRDPEAQVLYFNSGPGLLGSWGQTFVF